MSNATRRRRSLLGATALVLASAALSAAQTPAPPPLPVVVTAVLVNLTVKAGVDRAALAKTMPDEVRDTVQAYLDGKIQQWFARADGRGVMFIMNASSVADAKAVMDQLPLAKGGLADFEYTALGPLTPLRYLLGSAPAAKAPQ